MASSGATSSGSSFELPVNDEIVKLGIASIDIVRNDIYLTPDPTTFKGNNKASRIISRLIKGEVSKTVALICRKLRTREVDSDTVEALEIHLTNYLADYYDKIYADQKCDADNEQREKDAILNEINQARNGNGKRSSGPNNNGAEVGLTFEKWQQTLVDKFHIMRQTVKQNMPEIWEGLEFVLSVLRILNIAKCTLPLIGVLLAPPSSFKTVIISLVRGWYCVLYRDNFTPAAFVTNSMSVNSEEELARLDLLPQMTNHLFLTPELNTIFTAREEVVSQLLGIISRIADGEGLMTHTGAHGARGYEGPLMFTWIGAAIDIPFKIYKLLGNIGAKMYFFRLSYEEVTTDKLLADLDEDFDAKKTKIKVALFDYLKWFDICPTMEIPKGINPPIPKMEWDKTKDSAEARRMVASLAILLSHLRCPVATWSNISSTSNDNNVNSDKDEKGAGAGSSASEGSSSSTELNYSVSLPENPKRANRILNNLANGHALLTGRNYVTLDDIPVVIKTALSTGPIDRVKLLSLLIAHKGKLTTPLIVQSLNTSKYVARKTMTEFKAIGLIDMEFLKLDDNCQSTQYNNRTVAQITLKEKFRWLLDKFERLREGFEPQDYSGYVDSNSSGGSRDRGGEREGRDPTPRQTQQNDSQGSQRVEEAVNVITTTAEKQSAFWKIYGALESEQASNPDATMEVDKYTVSGQELKNRLVASGQFFVDQATAIIEHMVKATKQLEKVSFDTYRKVEK
jgi:hypothetical protein